MRVDGNRRNGQQLCRSLEREVSNLFLIVEKYIDTTSSPTAEIGSGLQPEKNLAPVRMSR
ncbi:hypothetical protein [Methanorbis rubei]|uniref:Uncharacterized protein n=1 Tax=Methanorbis rubei TaxID=3028300 RepID=A0AAE4SC65_9EURY|nr:hypothetical protein [Methanocorpusculaceae archaeon Cs1]